MCHISFTLVLLTLLEIFCMLSVCSRHWPAAAEVAHNILKNKLFMIKLEIIFYFQSREKIYIIMTLQMFCSLIKLSYPINLFDNSNRQMEPFWTLKRAQISDIRTQRSLSCLCVRRLSSLPELQVGGIDSQSCWNITTITHGEIRQKM